VWGNFFTAGSRGIRESQDYLREPQQCFAAGTA
jgi:hypothetical protein